MPKIVEPHDVLRTTPGRVRTPWRDLEAELRREVRGEVRFDAGSRALYATDGSSYRQVPIGVVVPRTISDVEATVAACRRHDVPVLSRGGGTSLAGQCCNVAVVLDFSKYLTRVLALDPEERTARVEPGVVLDVLREQAERHHLTFAPDPSTHQHCTLGGMIGNNSCGVHSLMGGKTVENVRSLDVLCFDGTRLSVGATSDDELERRCAEPGRAGEIYRGLRDLRDRYAELIRERYPRIPRRVSGYNLDELLPENGFHVARALVGTEATCVTVLGATVDLVPSPPARTLLVLGYDNVYVAADHVPQVLDADPIGLEGIDDRLVEDMRKKGLHTNYLDFLPEGNGWLVAEFGGETKEEADDRARKLMKTLGRIKTGAPTMKLYDDPAQEKKVWEVRESGLGATAFVPGERVAWEGWEDAAVAPEKLGAYLRDFRALLDEHGYGCALYGHFGQGCVHTRIDFDLTTAEGIARTRAFVEAAADLVVSYGGSLSGEHGDGQSRAELLPKMFGPELVQAFREFKAIWDPDGMMNPGKIVDPYRIDDNLRLGTAWRPEPRTTRFAFANEGGWEGVAIRCVGVGKCRDFSEETTMCPSYMVTREEQHSTRGRAHLLFEMTKGETLTDGWRDEHVKEALDLCLACKGCKNDCPVNVDMATYKAEFLSHYYRGRVRPRAAYAMGLIMWWARAGSATPGVANAVAGNRLAARALKRLGGVAQERDIPRFASQTFRAWFGSHARSNPDGTRVLLWPDTFTNAFRPEAGIAAVRALEDAGYRVIIPPEVLCCGRPLYDYGMLTLARRFLRGTLATLRPAIAQGIPMIGLEPSCIAVFRDEMTNMLPHDLDARRLKEQTFTLAEFLLREGYEPPRLPARALVQGHCHHRAVMKFDAEEEFMRKMGLDVSTPGAGCCGMAGSFGFEAGDRYAVSVRAGERTLLPAVRAADEDTLILADGFSCREQILQGTGREAMHLAQALRMAQTASTIDLTERSTRDEEDRVGTAG